MLQIPLLSSVALRFAELQSNYANLQTLQERGRWRSGFREEARKLEHGFRMISAGIPYTLPLRP